MNPSESYRHKLQDAAGCASLVTAIHRLPDRTLDALNGRRMRAGLPLLARYPSDAELAMYFADGESVLDELYEQNMVLLWAKHGF